MDVSLLQRVLQQWGPQALLQHLSPEERAAVPYVWRLWGRPDQFAPAGDWRFWLVQAGRGYGKTRLGAEWVRQKARTLPGSRGALVAGTPGEARDVMITGPSGLLAMSPDKERPLYEPSKRLLTWPLVPGQGQCTTAGIYSAHNFEQLRGPQYHWGWLDELGKWRYATEAFDQFNFGLRLGKQPQCCITTTPRPIKVIRKLLKDKRCVVTRGRTFDNAANLAEDYLAEMADKYQGTRLGRQELDGDLLDDLPGALWKRSVIDADRVKAPPWALSTGRGEVLLDEDGRPIPDLDVIVVGVDPSVADNKDAEEEDAGGEKKTDLCGIVAAGRRGHGLAARYYVLEDASLHGSPDEWGSRVVEIYDKWQADRIIAEVNNGGALVEALIKQKDPLAKYKAVHASRGKKARAEPISALYEQHRVHHVGTHEELEDQMCTYVPHATKKSPDRMDAAVWALTDLSTGTGKAERFKQRSKAA
jgi:phage terminase large subunit-like protein